MKIAIVQGAFLPVPPRRGGAVEKIWLGLGREFARRGHEVLHVSRLCDGLPAEEEAGGVRYRRVRGADAPGSRLLLKWQDLLYTRRVAAMLPKSDLVVTNTFWAPLVLRPERHGPLWVHVQRYPHGQMKHYRRAARLQTVSRVIQRAIVAEAPQFAERVLVIPNPLPDGHTGPPVRARDPDLVLYTGRVHPEKGLDLLLSAMIRLRQARPETRLRIVGPWQEQYGGAGEAYLRKLRAQAEPLGRAVEFTGPVFGEGGLAAHYDEAAVFVYPSLAEKGEASPVAPLEAMAHGLPIILSDLECFDDTVAGGIFSRSFNHRAVAAPARLAGVIEGILDQPGSWPAMAEAARARAAEFSLDRIATRYLEAFAALVPAAR